MIPLGGPEVGGFDTGHWAVENWLEKKVKRPIKKEPAKVRRGGVRLVFIVEVFKKWVMLHKQMQLIK